MSENYVGGELRIFEYATNWKRYFGALIAEYIAGDVLEVGAGIGGTTTVLCRLPHASWTCLEPDGQLASSIEEKVRVGELPPVRVVRGGIESLPEGTRFDTILYIDVLEHIEDDAAEMQRAAARLKSGGHLVVLSPAHERLFSAFDSAIGHFRRYDEASLEAVRPSGTSRALVSYLDSVGMLASLSNRKVLRQTLPSINQIRFWDKFIIPLSRIVDPLLRYRFGRSIVAIWRSE